jgi:hypothetical protein
MPTSTILSDNGISSGTTGIKTAGGDDGSLILQTTNSLGAATTALTINTTQVVSLVNALPAGSGGTGAATLTAESVVIGNGTSSVKFVAPGTASNVLTSNGTAWVSQAAAAGGGDYVMQVFTSPGTWTKAAGLKAIKVTVIGGGGGVSGSAPGRTGGTSSFGSPAFLSATGGTSSPVSAGGSGSGGTINVSGGTGSSSNGCGGVFTISGAGAFGFGAAITGSPQAPGQSNPGRAYGGGGVYTGNGAGGGGGAIEYIDAPALPGPQPYTVGAGATGELASGGAGVIIVEEFY